MTEKHIRAQVRKILFEAVVNDSDSKDISKRFTGKAKAYHFPYGKNKVENGHPWFTILIFNERLLEKVVRSLKDYERTSQYDLTITTDNDELSDEVHSGKLYKQLISATHFDEMKQKNPNLMLMAVFVVPKEEKVEPTHTYYHVSYVNITNGLIPQSNMKYKDRIYLWKDLKSAQLFSTGSFRSGPNKKAYIYQVEYSGHIYRDFEENEKAVYIKEPVPQDNLKLIHVIDLSDVGGFFW